MGLDAYAYVVEDMCVHCKRGKEQFEIMYWRGHRELQAWMTDLYYAKGGNAEYFNSEDVELTLEDLSVLEKYVVEVHKYEEDSYREDKDLRFIETARSAIASGKRVVYSSSW